MPKLFMVSGYTVYFWSNENGEPIHVHIAKGKPTPKSTSLKGVLTLVLCEIMGR